MRHFLAAAISLAVAFLCLTSAWAFEVISVPEDVNAVNLSAVVEIVPGQDGRVQLSTAPDSTGIIRRIEVLAAEQGTNPAFALIALRNDSDQQIERLLVAPFFRLPGSGVFQPDLGEGRVTAVTPSAGIRPVRLADPEADVFEVTLDPGSTVTLVAELTSGNLPELYLWQPNAYRDYVNSFTLFRGVVLGVAALAAVFLTIMFVVKGRGVFPATAAVAWAVLVYLLIDFGIMGRLFGLSPGGVQPLRAAAEAGIATALAGFLFIYLNLHRWHLRFIHLALGLAALFLALFAFAFFQPAIAASIARLVLALLGVSGFFLILLLALRGYDRAVLLVPTWIIYIAWLFYAWLVISGQVSNDVAQPAVAGGLVLIVMLLGFTAVQHAFAEGQVSIGTLSEVERRALALTGSGDFVFDWNIERDRVTVSDELGTRLGEKRGTLRGAIKRWLDRVHPDDRDRFRTAFDTLVELRRGKVSADMRIASHDGSYRTFRMRVKPVLGGDGQVNRIVGTLQDVTEDRAARERLLHDAVHDSLTGLPNRQLFLDRLERALVRARIPGGTKPAVFLIDIDRFMELEERIGHSAADSVLLAISRRIARIMRPLDTVARVSGDQFAVILSSEQAASKIAETAEQIRKALKSPFNFGDRDLVLTASIGVTIYDSNPSTAEDVLRDAELAMYYAKRLGGDRIEAYRASARSIAAYNKASEEDLERGMKQGELHVQFQPIMDLQTGQMAGAEALMRWTHPTRGLVMPDEFVPLAERSGQIEKLGRLAFEQAAAQAREWMTTPGLPEGFFISVNLSPTQLATETLLTDMRNLLSRDKELAAHLKLEITESQAMTNPEHSAHMLEALRNLGVGVALDDFGTGHSSLSYLHRFPIDTIKIAAPFVRLSTENGIAQTQAPIIRAVVALATDLDLLVIAEGVETQDEVDRLRDLNCRYAQGFVFGSAMTGVELGKKLAVQLGR
ncbi:MULTISPECIES: EAL domain-containing protein [Devosia]|uniref:Cyclic di-GMP phosphodiesterase Gmr n=1 Tax=Devosia equisanguinis TaxID=2490941 RepID=A0A3S4DPC4_9HYPH|nr:MULTISPECIES: EAL domain-containing protein [Devosia]ODT47546.1 MAG: diguanylate cyclase [Pelagibacterium sp. SCN 63-126]ODU86358.1 MAG: diguanylate cyclase [Pelagibacterium sp. SCN 63-17]OJX42746.1 MAG: sensor domain-containing phosphodiesterase [Devosia sp. 63-57]VDS04081.1 Cyclic di-GMP phosphodiesterase Gmr [Devosia equisanguinis]